MSKKQQSPSTSLFKWTLREADATRALEVKQAELEGELAAIAARLAQTQQLKTLELAKERLKKARAAALDVPDVHAARDAVTAAKTNFEALPDAVVGKRLAGELKEIDQATREKRRAMVAALFRREAPVVIAAAPAPAIAAPKPAEAPPAAQLTVPDATAAFASMPAPAATPPPPLATGRAADDPAAMRAREKALLAGTLCPACEGTRDCPRLVPGPILNGKPTPPVACPRAFHVVTPDPTAKAKPRPPKKAAPAPAFGAGLDGMLRQHEADHRAALDLPVPCRNPEHATAHDAREPGTNMVRPECAAPPKPLPPRKVTS